MRRNECVMRFVTYMVYTKRSENFFKTSIVRRFMRKLTLATVLTSAFVALTRLIHPLFYDT